MNYIFDFGGTLADMYLTTPQIIKGFQQLIATDLNVPLHRVQAAEKFMNQNEAHLFSYNSRVKMNTLGLERNAHLNWFSGILRYLGEDVDSKSSLLKRLCEESMTGIKYFLYEDSYLCLKQIKKKGDRAYILSNGLPSRRQVIEKLGLDKVIDKIYVSSELGLEKPFLEIYQFVLNDLQAKPSETVFVDDQIDCVEAANSLDILSFRIVRKKRVRKSKWDVSSLAEIIGKT